MTARPSPVARGLGELIFIRFSKTWRVAIGFLIAILIVANALNIAADLVAVGAGMNLLHAGSEVLWAVIAGGAIIVLLVSGSFEFVAKVLKVLCAALLAYLAELFFVTIPWGTVLSHTIVPHLQFNKAYIALLIAVLGTTISPYLFFWQSMQRLEDLRAEEPGGDKPLPLSSRSNGGRTDETGRESIRRLLRHGVLQRRDVCDHRCHGAHHWQARTPRHDQFTGTSGHVTQARRRSVRDVYLRPRLHWLRHVGHSRPRRCRVGRHGGPARSSHWIFELAA